MYVMTESQLRLARNAQDWDRFQQSSRKKVERIVDAICAPKLQQTMVDPQTGQKIVVVFHRETGLVLDVLL